MLKSMQAEIGTQPAACSCWGLRESVIDRRLQVPQLLAGVVALAVEDVPVKVAGAYELAQRVRELNLAARAALGLLQQRKNLGGKDVTADDGVVGGRIDLRLL